MLLFCVFLISPNQDRCCFCVNETTTYAKVLADCNLYKSKEMINNVDDVYFQVPETYFVVVLENVNEDCLKVQYGRFVGYVDASCVVISNFTPIVKTLDDVLCSIKKTSGTQIWSKPSTSGDVLTTINAGTENINYIASCYGDVPSGGESNVWFYVSYTPIENSTNVYEGYIYSENVAQVSEIVLNHENNPENIFDDELLNENTLLISSTIKTIIIAIVSIPIILFFVIILYKLTKIFQKNTKQKSFQHAIIENESDKIERVERVDIDKFKVSPFTKIHKRKDAIPAFPDYDHDEDLL